MTVRLRETENGMTVTVPRITANMWSKRVFALVLSVAVLFTSGGAVSAKVQTFPYVKDKMTESSYWTERRDDADTVLATRAMIKKLNLALRSDSNTNMTDLKAISGTVDGKAMNEALLQAATADAEHFGTNKYDAAGNSVTEDYYAGMIANTQGSDTGIHELKYGVAVKRTTIRVFPTDLAILDDPGDNDFDNLYNSGLRVNEPFVIKSVSADGKYYYGCCDCCSGWVKAEDIAVCSDRSQWLDAWDHSNSEILVVYGSKVMTEDSNTAPETANRLLTMGTVLELAEDNDALELISNRSAYYNYAVFLPIRGADGSYGKKKALISRSEKVHEGYLELTEENIISVSFEMLGDAYGWGGMLNSEDCSGFVRGVYKCFGLNLARNTSWQSASPVKKYSLTGYSDEQKKEIIKNLPLGSTLFFPGHEMTYIGTVNDRIYVISSTSSIMDPKKDGEKLRARGVIINTLDVKRANGKTWLESLSAATIPFAGEENPLFNESFVGTGFSDAMKKTELTGVKLSGKKLNVEWTPAETDTYIEGYQIKYYDPDDSSLSGKVTVKDPVASSYTVKLPRKAENIVVMIRHFTTADGKKYYSGWSEASEG